MENLADIVLVADATGDRADPVILEMLAFANQLKMMTGGSVGVWLLGEAPEAPAREIAKTGGVDVTALQCPGLTHYVGEAFGRVLSMTLAAAAPAYVVTAHTSGGAEWAPAVAARLGAGCISGIDGLGSEDDRIWFSKDRYGGKVKGRFVSHAPTTVLTVQPGVFAFDGRPQGGADGRVVLETVAWTPEQSLFTGVAPAPPGAANLADAAIIVAAGNGVGDEEHLAWIHRLAERLPKAMVAGTRLVCDRGWLGYDRQVGVTGATVAPALYIACGISGASQHLMGMRGSECVIAINTDPQAPICGEADICIIEDLTTFIPLMLEIYAKQMEEPAGG